MSGSSAAPAGRRQAPRLATNLKVSFEAERASGSAYTLDLSMSGMFLQSAEELRPADWMRLGFQVSLGQERKPVQAFGQVIRTLSREKAAEYGLLPGVALEFRSFVQGRDELRSFLSRKLGVGGEEVGEAHESELPAGVHDLGRPGVAASAGTRGAVVEVQPVTPPVQAAPAEAEPPPRRRPHPSVAGQTPTPPPVSYEPPQAGDAPQRHRVPVRARATSLGSLEPPPVNDEMRRASGPARPEQGVGPEAQWSQDEWQDYFATVRREKEAAQHPKARPEAGSDALAPVLSLALRTTGAVTAIFLMLWLVHRLFSSL
jgi:hypothetical protein